MGEQKENPMLKDPSSLLIFPSAFPPAIAAAPFAIGLAVLTVICTLVPGCSSAAEDNPAAFAEVSPHVFLFRDTCNVYIIRTGDTGIAVDCGSAKVLRHLSEI